MGFIGPESRKQLKLFARFATAGFELAASVVVGYFGGRYLDGKLATSPYLANLGLLLGIVAGFRNLFKLAKDAQSPPSPPSASPQDNEPHDP